eukprot:507114_1
MVVPFHHHTLLLYMPHYHLVNTLQHLIKYIISNRTLSPSEHPKASPSIAPSISSLEPTETSINIHITFISISASISSAVNTHISLLTYATTSPILSVQPAETPKR